MSKYNIMSMYIYIVDSFMQCMYIVYLYSMEFVYIVKYYNIEFI